MRRHAALSHRLPPAPTPALPAAPAVEEPPGRRRAPMIPIPAVPLLLGVAAAPPTALPGRRCGAVLDSGPALGTPLASHLPGTCPRRPPRLPGQQRRCQRGGRSAAGPGAEQDAGPAPAAGAEREVPAGPARSRYTRGWRSPLAPGTQSSWFCLVPRGCHCRGYSCPPEIPRPGPSQVTCFYIFVLDSRLCPPPRPTEDSDLHHPPLPPAWNLSSPQKTLSLPIMSSSSVSISLCLFLSHAPNLFFIFSE